MTHKPLGGFKIKSDKAENEEVNVQNQDGQELSDEQLKDAAGGREHAMPATEFAGEEPTQETAGFGGGSGAGKISFQDTPRY